MNTDEFGNIRPFQEEPDSDEQEELEASVEDAPAEEVKAEGEADSATVTTTMINTSGPGATESAAAEAGQKGADDEAKEGEDNFEQWALDYLSLAL